MPAKPWVILPLVLPVGDKKYEIAPIEYDDGLTLIDVLRGNSKKIKDTQSNEVFFRLVMGGTWDEMKADHLPFNVMFRAGTAATQYQMALVNDQSAQDAVAAGERMWESGISPEALAAAMAANQNPTPKGSKRSPGTASATPTRSRASTKPTTSPKGTPRRGKSPAAPRSAGTSS